MCITVETIENINTLKKKNKTDLNKSKKVGERQLFIWDSNPYSLGFKPGRDLSSEETTRPSRPYYHSFVNH